MADNMAQAHPGPPSWKERYAKSSKTYRLYKKFVENDPSHNFPAPTKPAPATVPVTPIRFAPPPGREYFKFQAVPYERGPYPYAYPTFTPSPSPELEPTRVTGSRKRKAEDDEFELVQAEDNATVEKTAGGESIDWRRLSVVVSETELILDSLYYASIPGFTTRPGIPMSQITAYLGELVRSAMAVTYKGFKSLWSGRFVTHLYERRSRGPVDSRTIAVKRMKISNARNEDIPFSTRFRLFLRPLLGLGGQYDWASDSTKEIGREKLDYVLQFLKEAETRIDDGFGSQKDHNFDTAQRAEFLDANPPSPTNITPPRHLRRNFCFDDEPDWVDETEDPAWRDDRIQVLRDVTKTLEIIYRPAFFQAYKDFYGTPQSGEFGVPYILADEDLVNLQLARSMMDYLIKNPDFLNTSYVSISSIRAIVADISALEAGEIVPSFVVARSRRRMVGDFPDEDVHMDGTENMEIDGEESLVAKSGPSRMRPAINRANAHPKTMASDDGERSAAKAGLSQTASSVNGLEAISDADSKPGREASSFEKWATEAPMPSRSILKRPKPGRVFPGSATPGVFAKGAELPDNTNPEKRSEHLNLAPEPTQELDEFAIPSNTEEDMDWRAGLFNVATRMNTKRFATRQFRTQQGKRLRGANQMKKVTFAESATPETTRLKRRKRESIPAGRIWNHERLQRFIQGFPSNRIRWAWNRPGALVRLWPILEQYDKSLEEGVKRQRMEEERRRQHEEFLRAQEEEQQRQDALRKARQEKRLQARQDYEARAREWENWEDWHARNFLATQEMEYRGKNAIIDETYSTDRSFRLKWQLDWRKAWGELEQTTDIGPPPPEGAAVDLADAADGDIVGREEHDDVIRDRDDAADYDISGEGNGESFYGEAAEGESHANDDIAAAEGRPVNVTEEAVAPEADDATKTVVKDVASITLRDRSPPPPFAPPELDISPGKIAEINDLVSKRHEEEERARLEQERQRQEAKRVAMEKRKAALEAKKRARDEAELRARRERLEEGGLREPNSELIPPLDPEWVHRAQRTLSAKAGTTICKDSAGVDVSRTCFERLLPPTEWINDEAINGTLRWAEKYVNEKAGITDYNKQTPKCIAASSYFWSCFGDANPDAKIVRQLGNRQNRITPQNFLNVETILFPICKDNHWTLGVIKPKLRAVAYINSMRGLRATTQEKATNLLSIARYMLKDRFVASEWKVIEYDSPRQWNGWDCGLFVISNGICMCLGVDPSTAYKSDQLALQRLRVASVLLNGGFKGPFSLDKI